MNMLYSTIQGRINGYNNWQNKITGTIMQHRKMTCNQWRSKGWEEKWNSLPPSFGVGDIFLKLGEVVGVGVGGGK